jgi:hypothetical protein
MFENSKIAVQLFFPVKNWLDCSILNREIIWNFWVKSGHPARYLHELPFDHFLQQKINVVAIQSFTKMA